MMFSRLFLIFWISLAACPFASAGEAAEENEYPLHGDFPYGFWVIDKGFAEGWSAVLGDTYERHTEKIFRDLQRNHINALMMTHRPVSQWHLDTAVKYGMRITTMPQYLYAHIDHVPPANPEPIEVVLQRWRDHVSEIKAMKNRHGFLGYHIFDEPYHHFSGAIQQVADLVSELDPGYPALYTHQNMPLKEKEHPEEWTLLKSLSVILSDCYSVHNPYGRDPWYYGDVQIPEQRRPNPEAHQWPIVQAFGYGQVPTVPELRVMVYNNVAHGAKGMFFFVAGQSYISSNPKAPWFIAAGNPWFTTEPYIAEISRMGAHLTSAGPLLLPLSVNESYPVRVRSEMFAARVRSVAREVFVTPTDPLLRKEAIHTGAFTGDAYDILVVHNNDPWKFQHGTVDVKGRRIAYDLLTLEPVGQPTGQGVKWDVEFAPGDGRLYLLADDVSATDRAREVVLHHRWKHLITVLSNKLDLARAGGVNVQAASDFQSRAQEYQNEGQFEQSLLLLNDAAAQLDRSISENEKYGVAISVLDETRRMFVDINDWLMAHPEYQDPDFPERDTVLAFIDELVQLTGKFGRLENDVDDGQIDLDAAAQLQGAVESLRDRVVAFTPADRTEMRIAVIQIGEQTAGIRQLARYLGMLYSQVDIVPLDELQLDGYQLAWIHLDGESSAVNALYSQPVKLRNELLTPALAGEFRSFVESGRGLICTGLAAGLVTELKLEPARPNEMYWGPAYTPGGVEIEWERWNVCGKVLGLKPAVANHPLFQGFASDGFGVEEYDTAEIVSKAIWNKRSGSWPRNGTVLAGYFSDGAAISDDFAVAVEYALGDGKILLLGDMFDPALGATRPSGMGGWATRWHSPYHKLIENIVAAYALPIGSSESAE